MQRIQDVERLFGPPTPTPAPSNPVPEKPETRQLQEIIDKLDALDRKLDLIFGDYKLIRNEFADRGFVQPDYYPRDLMYEHHTKK